MKVNGTLINYYFHCKRQCYLHGNRLNLEDNSEDVKIGKAIHEEKSEQSSNTEIEIDNIKIDKLTKDYLIEVKKSDADVEAAKWQLAYYLKILRDKGIERKGKLEFVEKNKTPSKVIYIELNDEIVKELDSYLTSIENLLKQEEVPAILNKPQCKKCAYYEYCYI
ncbi:CRISPR-associated protein Cas4 [Clostridium cadaveris]|uniref:CRISPR-associated protein Cas4 n=1 Tax=Clostridium cadaveris TaxID=1529 RepID=UPI0031D70740